MTHKWLPKLWTPSSSDRPSVARHMTNPIRTAIVDDHPLFREGVAKLLARTPGVDMVADGGSAVDAVNIAQQFLPDVLLLDLKLPDDGLAAAATIVREHPSVRIVILTASDCDSDVAAGHPPVVGDAPAGLGGRRQFRGVIGPRRNHPGAGQQGPDQQGDC